MTHTSADVAGTLQCDTPDVARMQNVKFAVAAHLLHVIAMFQCGGFLLDPKGCILSLNAIAAASLGNGFAVRGNRFVPTDRTLDSLLRSTIDLVLNMTGSADAPAASIEINRAGRLPLLARFLRLDECIRPILNGASLLLVTFDPGVRRAPPAEVLMRVFGLTPTEAAIAIGIADNKSLKVIAAERETKIETVRVHSKKVFVKTRARGQLELAALLTRFAAMISTGV